MTQSPAQVLDLDAPLMLLALQEAAQHLDQLRVLLQAHGHSQHLDLCHAAILRLTYCLLRCPGSEADFQQCRALHNLSQAHLAARLSALPRFQAGLRSAPRSPLLAKS